MRTLAAAAPGLAARLVPPVLLAIAGWGWLAVRDAWPEVAADAALATVPARLVAAMPAAVEATAASAAQHLLDALARGGMLSLVALGMVASARLGRGLSLAPPGYAVFGAAAGALVLGFGAGPALAGPSLSPPLLLAAAMMAAAAAGLVAAALTEVAVLAPLGRAPLRRLLAGVGMLVVLGEVSAALIGAPGLSVALPGALAGPVAGATAVAISLPLVLAGATGLVVAAALSIARGSRAGLALRALASEPEVMQTLGYRGTRRISIALVLCGTVAGLGGFLAALLFEPDAAPGWPGFAALAIATALLAGPARLAGLFTAGLSLALVRTFWAGPGGDGTLAALLAAALLLLFWRPGGLAPPLPGRAA